MAYQHKSRMAAPHRFSAFDREEPVIDADWIRRNHINDELLYEIKACEKNDGPVMSHDMT